MSNDASSKSFTADLAEPTRSSATIKVMAFISLKNHSLHPILFRYPPLGQKHLFQFNELSPTGVPCRQTRIPCNPPVYLFIFLFITLSRTGTGISVLTDRPGAPVRAAVRSIRVRVVLLLLLPIHVYTRTCGARRGNGFYPITHTHIYIYRIAVVSPSFALCPVARNTVALLLLHYPQRLDC